MRRLCCVVSLVVLLASGCARQLGVTLPTVGITTNIPLGGSGILVSNNIPDSYLTVKRVGFHSLSVLGRIGVGESMFVRARYILDAQDIAVTVVGYSTDGEYIGLQTRNYQFYSGRHDIRLWDVQRNSLQSAR